MSLIPPENNANIYVLAVLELYVELPDTPAQASPLDEFWACRLQQQKIPLPVVETALLLGSLRRHQRSAQAPPLAAIRSLAYFQPIIDELLQTPVSDNFRAALRLKMRRLLGEVGPKPTRPTPEP